MTKSFVSLALVLGLMIFAQVCFVNAQGSFDDDYEEEGMIEQNPVNICTLLGKQACHIECTIQAHLYGYTAHGDCDTNDYCKCHVNGGDTSVHQEWNKVFDAEYVYRKIKDNDLSFKQVASVFLYPFRTAHEVKELVQGPTTPYQYAKLKIRDDNITNKLTTKDGALDEAAIRKLVAEKMETLLKTRKSKVLLAVNYKDRFRRALESSNGSQATLYNSTYRVNRLQNQSLENILDQYLKKHKLQKPKIDIVNVKKPGVLDIIDNVVTNELIKRIDESSRNPSKPAPTKSMVSRIGSSRLSRKAT